MKIAIYSPYLDTVGGGEKYILSIAECLSAQEEVDVLLDSHLISLDFQKIKERIQFLHGLDLSKVNFISAPIGIGGNFFKRAMFLRRYDWLFYLTDGSIFLPTSQNNIIHFQVPFENIGASNLWGNFKLGFWKEAIYNSQFTKGIVEKKWSIKGRVIYPPVSVELFKPLKKKKQIVSVGRFFGYTKAKKHELMIQTFRELSRGGPLKDWSLHLAGGVGEGDEDYLVELKKEAEGFEIYFHPDASLEELKILYGESTIYWHAAGFGEDDPKKFEHFGITTVEAMASGCIPVVINLGGQMEIVEDGRSGLLWNNLDELKAKTMEIIGDSEKQMIISAQAVERSKEFNKEKFQQNIIDLIYGN